MSDDGNPSADAPVDEAPVDEPPLEDLQIGEGDDLGDPDAGFDDQGFDDPMGDDFEDDEEKRLQTVVVPRLDDLVVKALAENYDVYPALDRIPQEYLDNVVALLDPSQIEFSVAAKYINAEKFWKRLCQERWPICQITSHGLSWKRLYIERHVQSLFEAYYPSSGGQNYERLMKEVDAGKPYAQTIVIQQLLSHLDLSSILLDFPTISNLSLKYGARKLGMDYDKSLFGMQLKDSMCLARLVSKTRTLNRLTLAENLLNDESVQVLTSGLAKNDTLTYLDLSHNKIGDTGAKRLARVLAKENSVLTHLDLGNNRIHEAGGRALALGLRDNAVLGHLSLKLNPLGDKGGIALLETITDNDVIRHLDLSGTTLDAESGPALCKLISANRAITALDVSSNEMQTDSGKDIVAALKSNTSLTQIDLRRNPVSPEVLEEIKADMATRHAAAKRLRRKGFENGWDEAL